MKCILIAQHYGASFGIKEVICIPDKQNKGLMDNVKKKKESMILVANWKEDKYTDILFVYVSTLGKCFLK